MTTIVILIYVISFIFSWITMRKEIKTNYAEGWGYWAMFLVICPFMNTVVSIYGLGNLLSKNDRIIKLFFNIKDDE